MASYINLAPLSDNGEASCNLDAPASLRPGALDICESQPHWYAMTTYPRHEKRVRDHLISRNVETFLPLYTKVNRWKNGCNAQIELPLFPGYIFVEIDPRERARVLGVPGTVSLVGTSREPWPLPKAQIQALRDGLDSCRFEPHAYLVVGQKVRIVAGPLAGLTGVLLRKNSSLRVVLALDQIMQGVAVEVSAMEVEQMTPAASLT